MDARVTVRIRDCACPDAPHPEGDEVFLEPTLPIDGGITAEQDLFSAAGDDRKLTRTWLKTFVLYGATGWNFVDAEGQPVPFDVSAILADWSIARPVANRASELYAHSVMAPFQNRPDRPSPTGQTRATTSRRRPRTQGPSA